MTVYSFATGPTRCCDGTSTPMPPERWPIVRMGEAAEEIVALAQQLGSRGIALGSRGLTATESLFLGSIAYKVVPLAKVPVLIGR